MRAGAPVRRGEPATTLPGDLGAALREVIRIFAAAGVPSPQADAELLAAHLLRTSRGGAVAAAIRGASTPPGYGELAARRARREPLQHLTGTAHFRGLSLAVGPGVFVPRPETEITAGLAIAAARELTLAYARPVRVADLGTGSGGIALAVAGEVGEAVVIAVESDPVAAGWAARNFASCPNVQLVRADATAALAAQSVDVVVTNPPYIPPGTEVTPEVGHDPAGALWGLGPDGLDIPRRFVAAAARALIPGGVFVIEHAETQAVAVRDLLAGAFTEVTTSDDLTGRPRVTRARRS